MTSTHAPDLRRRLVRPAPAFAMLLLAVVLGACTTTSTPAPTSSSSVPPSVEPLPSAITSAEGAAAAVIATDPRFAAIEAQNPDLIGGCCFWTATPSATGYDVTIEIGWGDCPAGCINRHRWFYEVATGGAVRLDREEGPALPAGVPGPADGTTGGPGIRGIASAGPVCPVVRPNDPACADRPVAGAVVHVLDGSGLEVATLTTDATGAFSVTLPPGVYQVRADAVEGLMGTAPAVDVTVGAGQAVVALQYDTGIR